MKNLEKTISVYTEQLFVKQSNLEIDACSTLQKILDRSQFAVGSNLFFF